MSSAAVILHFGYQTLPKIQLWCIISAVFYLRKATINDMDTIWSMFLLAKEQMEKEGNRLWSRGYPVKDDFIGDIKNQEEYLAYEDDALVGAFGLCFDALDYFFCQSRDPKKLLDLFSAYKKWDKKTPPVMIERFMILPFAQKKGYGKKMLEKLKEACPDHLYVAVTAEDRKTISFYLRNGFSDFGVVHGEDWNYSGNMLDFELLLSL